MDNIQDTKTKLANLKETLRLRQEEEIKNEKKKSGPKPKTELCNKRKLFVEHYISNGMNGQEAAISAGYSAAQAKTKASYLLKEPLVKEYLDKLKSEVKEKLDINRDWILNEYLLLIESCKIEGTDGIGTIKDRNNWNKALAQISKMCGLDAPTKLEVDSILNIQYINPIEEEDEEDENE